jgi:cell wall-associated NlpC family hydrolase
MIKGIVSTLFLVLFFIGCANKKQIVIQTVYVSSNKVDISTPQDLKIYPQTPYSYTKDIKPLSKKQLSKLYKQFFKLYFKPWNIHKMSMTRKNASWGENYSKAKMYGENYQPISKKWWKRVIKLSNMSKFGTVKQKAITVRNSNLRVLPSNKPLFKRFDQAGEGFPFDYNQNSSITLNSPLFISHYSTDRAWAYVESSFVSGWIDVNNIALVSDEVIKIFKSNPKYFVAIKDDFPIYKNGVFKDYVKLGTIFPSRKGKFVTIIRDNNGKGYISRLDKNKNIVSFPIKFNKKNLDMVISQLIGKPYGWGGLYGNRDCSLLTKDLLTPFGFPLQRNSFGQTRSGKYISLKGKSDKEKLSIIKQKGVPFLSLIYIKGHIALYIGIKNNIPLILHSTWGIKTIKNGIKGRHIIGKSIISSLEIGKELKYFNPKKNILHRVQGLVLLN